MRIEIENYVITSDEYQFTLSQKNVFGKDSKYAGQKMKEIGKCYYCSESISAGCFCDSFCRTDWENRRRADLMRGKAA